MYPITSVGKTNFQAGRKQYCNISITNGSSSISFNESKLRSLKFTRQSANQNIAFGEAIATQLDFTLDNADGYFNNFSFTGAEVSVQIGVETNADPYYIPCGYFTIDSTPRVLNQIQISALDRMVQFDKKVDISSWFPCTIKSMIEHICQACNVTLGTDLSTFPNQSYVVNEVEVDTLRELLMYGLEIMGKVAYIDWNGRLIIGWYSGTAETIDESLRFSSDLKDSITFGGVSLTIDKDTYEVGNGNKFAIVDNPLVHDTNFLSNLSYDITLYPFTASTLPLPYLYPLDKVDFVKGPTSHVTYVTGICYELNGSCTLECVGEITELSYAKINPLTSRERNIIEIVKQEFNEQLNARVQEISQLNELVYNAMGFYKTEETSGDAVVFYMHDAPLLSESTKVWKMTADGFFWTNDYQSGVWQSGISASGDAWFNKVSAIGLTLASGSEYSSHFTPDAWDIMRGSMAVMKVTTNNNEAQMQIPKLVIDDPSTPLRDGYIEIGRIRFTPININGSLVGAGIIMVD